MAVPARRVTPRALAGPVLAALACAALGCATTTSGSTTRELPTGLGSLGAYLEGCSTEGADDGVVRMRCPDGVMVAARTRSEGVAEARYRAEAFGMAQLVGGRLVWDQVAVETEGPPVTVDRARALVPGSDVASGTLLGVVRKAAAHHVEELWCTAGDDAGEKRCHDLLAVVLGRPAAAAPRASVAADATDADGASDADGAAAGEPPPARAGPVTLFGRALSVPTTCEAKVLAEGADVKCHDGASISWRRFAAMEDATQIVHATLEALGDTSEGEPYPCTIAGEAARCAEHPRAAAGLTYLDGKAVAVLCLGVEAARSHPLCRAVLAPAKP